VENNCIQRIALEKHIMTILELFYLCMAY